jgi:hypothetical protein
VAKKYTLEKSKVTGEWVWACKNGLGGGSSSSKELAKDAAKKACGSGFVLVPPDIDVHIYRGHLATFSVSNLDGDRVTFSAEEISQAAFQAIFGMEIGEREPSKPVDIVVALLKIWGVYRGGVSEEAIRKYHDLTPEIFGRLASKRIEGLTLTIDDDRKLKWTL